VFYGWVIVGVTLLAQFIALGTAFYSFSPLIAHLETDLGATRAQITVAMSWLTLIGTLGGVPVGWLVDRGSIRRVMAIGAVLFAVGVLALAHVQTVWQLWLVYAGPIALGMACLGGVANARLLANWFSRRRGLALGLAIMGVSLSGIVVPVLMGELVAAFGWRGAARALVALPLLFAPLLLLVVDDPASRGLYPDGLDRPPSTPQVVVRDPGFRSVASNPTTWLLSLCFALSLTVNGGIVVQVYEYARDLGLDRAAMGLAVAAMAAGGGIGKPVYGWLSDRWSPRRALLLALGLMILGLVLFLRASSAPSLLTAGAIFGTGFAGLMPLQIALTAEIFGRDVLGRVLGLLGPAQLPFTMSVHPLMGWIHDTTGSYALAFQIFIGYCVLSGVILLLIPASQPQREAVSAT
jgi:MFS family permease